MLVKLFASIIISIILVGCTFKHSSKPEPAGNKNVKQGVISDGKSFQDTIFVRKWLSEVITNYLNAEDLKTAHENLQAALTSDYFNYKSDAIALEYSEMSREEFDEKWKAKYDTRFVGNGSFLASAQDNGRVEVKACTFKESLNDTTKVFHTIIYDTQFKTDFVMDVTVKLIRNRLLIDDVKEYQ